MKLIVTIFIFMLVFAVMANSAEYTIQVTKTRTLDAETGLFTCKDWVTIPDVNIKWTMTGGNGEQPVMKVFPVISDPSVISRTVDQKWFVVAADDILMGYYELSFNIMDLVGLIDLVPKPNKFEQYWLRYIVNGGPPSDPFPRVLLGKLKLGRPIPSE